MSSFITVIKSAPDAPGEESLSSNGDEAATAAATATANVEFRIPPTDEESQSRTAGAEGNAFPSSSSNGRAANMRRLSTVARMYDVNGDGVLDDTEMAMRSLDRSNRGFLTNDRVYELMQEQLMTQAKLFKARRIIVVLIVTVVVLALCNLGTSFAAASLAKDTSTSSNAELLDRSTRQQLSTQSSTSSLAVRRATIGSDGTRRLCTEDGGCGDAASSLTMDGADCEALVESCRRGNSVSVVRPVAGDDVSFPLCPFDGGSIGRGRSVLTRPNGASVEVLPIGDGTGGCVVDGDGVRQAEGGRCDVDDDCRAGLGCEVPDGVKVNACRERCHPTMEWCLEDCQLPVCTGSDVEVLPETAGVSEAEQEGQPDIGVLPETAGVSAIEQGEQPSVEVLPETAGVSEAEQDEQPAVEVLPGESAVSEAEQEEQPNVEVLPGASGASEVVVHEEQPNVEVLPGTSGFFDAEHEEQPHVEVLPGTGD